MSMSYSMFKTAFSLYIYVASGRNSLFYFFNFKNNVTSNYLQLPWSHLPINDTFVCQGYAHCISNSFSLIMNFLSFCLIHNAENDFLKNHSYLPKTFYKLEIFKIYMSLWSPATTCIHILTVLLCVIVEKGKKSQRFVTISFHSPLNCKWLYRS